MTAELEMGSHAAWGATFEREQERLLGALRHVTDGGVVEGVQHIGATSVPGMPAVPCVDIGLSVWPFPLTSAHTDVLADLGYAPIAADDADAVRRFRHRRQPIELWTVETGADEWLDWQISRDFLRADPAARGHFAASKVDPANARGQARGRHEYFADILAPAHTWWIEHHGFAPLHRAVHALADYSGPWWVSSGWALDLFLGRVTRVHHDVDVVLPHADQMALQAHLLERGWRFVAPLDGRLEPWPRGLLIEPPRHQVHAHRQDEFIDFLLTDVARGIWRYRREPSIVQSVERMQMQSADGIRFIAPELALLFKSRNTSTSGRDRPKDQRDFEATLPHLDAERRAWLRWALIAQTPDHPWLALL